MEDGLSSHRIVVGVVASEESEEALRWAARYAQSVGGQLDVVHVWNLPAEHIGIESMPPPTPPTETAREALAKVVERVMGRDPAVPVTTSVMEGHAAKELIDRPRERSSWWWAVVAGEGSMAFS
ncbi:MAG TPA: universal stress protein [Acidimicrobiales bacterium]|nr:universal stress protein [Acidimicrobiales bacterium]